MNTHNSTLYKAAEEQCDLHAERLRWAMENIGALGKLTPAILAGLNPVQLAILDQFIVRFSKLQDQMGTRLLPLVLELTQEQGNLTAFIDKLNRLEKIGAIESAQQWLQLRNLEQRVRPDILMFPDFDANLRDAFRRETELLFEHVLRNDLPVHELLTANYTFVNERLARHYGIKGVYGARFRKVDVTDPNRYGLFGHGSLLALTSVSSRTSPIIRGKFIQTEFWNNPPPSPPADVPALEESAPKDRPSTVREQLELHRANPNCATCHNVIDPPGFALENFDAVGQWRDKTAEGLEIDASGVLADGSVVDGPAELREALVEDPEIFASTVT